MKVLICTLCAIFFFATGFTQEEKYHFIFLYNELNAQTQQMQAVFTDAMQEVPNRAKGTLLKKSDDRDVVKKYSLQHAPTPFVLVLAPNGAIMGGFPVSFTKEQLLSSFAPPVVEKSLLALQNHKLVLLCVQNSETKDPEAAMQGVREFKADPRYNSSTEIVMLDPNDSEGMNFLDTLNIAYPANQSLTVFLAPPAEIVGSMTGPTTKAQLISTIEKASSGCCPGGCCPGGCCPGGKCGG